MHNRTLKDTGTSKGSATHQTGKNLDSNIRPAPKWQELDHLLESPK
jgi:hypothetical protein